jgi:hypothetical protein
MFSPETITLIKATVPLLQIQGEAITQNFYRTMFRDYPEVRSFFNEAHRHPVAKPAHLLALSWLCSPHRPTGQTGAGITLHCPETYFAWRGT